MCNIGLRPTLLKKSELSVEVHFFEPVKKMEGHHVVVQLMHLLREEKKFSSKEALIKAIANDVKRGRACFSCHKK